MKRRRQRSPLLRWALRLGACCLGPLTAEARVGPTNQPATPGQDSQECGFMLLPERFQLWPSTPGWFSPGRTVAWESMDRATFVTCHQGLFPWIPQAVHCFVDAKLLFKSENFQDSDTLPEEVARYIQRRAGFDTTILRDCNHAVQYVLQSRSSDASVYKVYNRMGELVAQTLQDTALSPGDVMRVTDEQGLPVAVAQTPALQAAVSFPATGPVAPAARAPPTAREDDNDGDLRPWQLRFFDAYTSPSSLIIAQNRWLLAAVVQDRALRGVWRAPSPIGRLCVPLAVSAVLLGGLAWAASSLTGTLFRPREKLEKQGSEAPAAPYGSLAGKARAPQH